MVKIKLSKEIIVPVISLLAFAVIAAGVFFISDYFKKNPILKTLKAEEAAKIAVDYANEKLLAGQAKAEYISVEPKSGVYAFILKVEGQEYTSYVTKDGKMLFVTGYEIAPSENKPEAVVDVVKSDKPDVKIFVMSYCPYGLQAQKMYLPVYDLLKDKVDMGVYFVNYAMHGKVEIDENLRQYCIQKDQKDKFSAYLTCFTEDTKYTTCSAAGGKDCTGNFSGCIDKAGVDKAKLQICIADTDKQFNITKDFNDKSTWANGTFPKFAVNNDLNEQYGVEGSPTIVINGKQANVGTRSPDQFLKTICAAFNNKPEECNTELSKDQKSTMFGEGTSTGADAGGCATE